MSVCLLYGRGDEGVVYKKQGWNDTLMFAWCEKAGYYGYCRIHEGKITFKPPYHNENRKAGYKVSRVGEGVLGCSMIIITRIKAKIMKNKKIKYMGMFYNADDELQDSEGFYSKKEAKKALKTKNCGWTLELYRADCKLKIDLPVIEKAL